MPHANTEQSAKSAKSTVSGSRSNPPIIILQVSQRDGPFTAWHLAGFHPDTGQEFAAYYTHQRWRRDPKFDFSNARHADGRPVLILPEPRKVIRYAN